MLYTGGGTARSTKTVSVDWVKERDPLRRAATGRARQLPREQWDIRLAYFCRGSQSCAAWVVRQIGRPLPRKTRGPRRPTRTLIMCLEPRAYKLSGYSIVVSTYRCGAVVASTTITDETPVRFRLATIFASLFSALSW